jgi:heme/copper-type cytochrome/quinol oxidase subunit 2
MFVLVIMLAVCLGMWPLLRSSRRREAEAQQQDSSSGSDSFIILVISMLMVVLTLFTMWKVYKRWRRANSVVTIAPLAAEQPPRLAGAHAATVALLPMQGAAGNPESHV